MAKVIFSGLEGSGKTYQLAKISVKLAYRNGEWIEQGLTPRPIVSNLPYSQEFKDLCASMKVPLFNWRNLDELVNWQGTNIELMEADLLISELATYFDSRNFKDLPLNFRLWLSQCDKMGVDIYGDAQDFAQVDLAFRRLTTELYYITKLCGSGRPAKTKPPINFVWGLCTKKEMDPKGYDESKQQFNQIGIFPKPFFLRKATCDVFDTNARVPKSEPPRYKHIMRRCELENCNMDKIVFIHGVKHQVLHV